MSDTNRIFFGYDKYFLSIYSGDIIKYYNIFEGKYKIGHLWLYERDHYQGWVISFNHAYSEVNEAIEDCGIRNVTKLGNIENNENILKQHWNGDVHI